MTFNFVIWFGTCAIVFAIFVLIFTKCMLEKYRTEIKKEKNAWTDFAKGIDGSAHVVKSALPEEESVSYVNKKFDGWLITIDKEYIGSEPCVKLNQFKAPYIAKDDLEFSVDRKDFYNLFGVFGIKTGYPEIDGKFCITLKGSKGTNEAKIIAFFANTRLRKLIQYEPSLRITVTHSKEPHYRNWLAGKYPAGIKQLYLSVEGNINECERLEKLYELFVEMLNQLYAIGSASKESPSTE